MLFYAPPDTTSGKHQVHVTCKRPGVTLRYRAVHHFTEAESDAGNTLLAGR